VVSDLLNAEGFTNVVYVESDAGVEQTKAIAKGDIDFTLHFSGPLLLEIDRGASITFLAGVHVGCFELFAKEGIRSVADLKGRTVGQQGLGSSPHVFISAMATLVGLDPAKDIEWVTSAKVKPIELFAEGKIDAFLGFPSGTTASACAEHRSCHRQQCAGSPMVAVLLLHVGGES
jgi:NitT/TauT family transport system substrate-binding protein